MKQIIILVCSVILGVSIFSIVAGGDDSIYSSVRGLWQAQFDRQSVMFSEE